MRAGRRSAQLVERIGDFRIVFPAINPVTGIAPTGNASHP